MKKIVILPILLIIIIVSFILCCFTVDVTEQAIVTRLGKPVRTVSEPGLHFKLPFIENTTFFSKKLEKKFTQLSV